MSEIIYDQIEIVGRGMNFTVARAVERLYPETVRRWQQLSDFVAMQTLATPTVKAEIVLSIAEVS